MRTKKLCVRIISVLISALMLFGVIPSAAESNEFVSENVFANDTLKSKGNIDMYVNTGTTETTGVNFNQNGALDIATDNDISVNKPIYDATEWEYPRYFGAVFTLNENTYLDHITLYTSGKFRIYVSDALDTLYSQYNCVADGTSCELSGTEIELTKYARYIAIFSMGFSDFAEIQAWTGNPSDEPELTDSLKVLTIGNSFSENTSIYASQIAAENGKALTFGYLKYPSCNISQHWQAANQNLAVFKFEIVSPDGTRTTLKNEAASFENPDPDNSATISEALQYTDWDVIVFQQESFSSRDSGSFSDLANLIPFRMTEPTRN